MERGKPSSQKKRSEPLIDRLEIIRREKNEEKTNLRVSQSLGLSSSTINYIWNKLKKTGMIEDIKKPGRPREVFEREEKMLIEEVQAHENIVEAPHRRD